MIWVAPSEKDSATETLEKRLWSAADPFRANSGPKSQEYSAPVLGLIFLRLAEARAKIQEVFGGAHAPSRVVDRAPAVNPERSARARNAAPGAGALPIEYRDVPGLCRAATLKEIEAQGWSLIYADNSAYLLLNTTLDTTRPVGAARVRWKPSIFLRKVVPRPGLEPGTN